MATPVTDSSENGEKFILTHARMEVLKALRNLQSRHSIIGLGFLTSTITRTVQNNSGTAWMKPYVYVPDRLMMRRVRSVLKGLEKRGYVEEVSRDPFGEILWRLTPAGYNLLRGVW